MKENIIAHSFSITQSDRSRIKAHEPFLLWFTGLSGSGKSTLANAVEKVLVAMNVHTYILDGDNVRKGLNGDLTFSKEDRKENIRRIAEVGNLMVDAGLVVLSSFISPYIEDRQRVKDIVGSTKFIEVYVSTPIEECEKRDVKGLYAKARSGEIKDFTGISAPYEFPLNPDITIDTSDVTIEKAVQEVITFINSKLNLEDE